MAVKAVSINDKGFDKAVKGLEQLAKLRVKVGIQADSADDKYDEGESVLDVAVYNEFGTRHIPARPFIRQCYAQHGQQAGQLLAKTAKAVSGGASPHAAMARVGEWYQGKMRHTLLNYPWTPNHALTIKRKGSSKPLVDTGQLVNSIRYEVDSA